MYTRKGEVLRHRELRVKVQTMPRFWSSSSDSDSNSESDRTNLYLNIYDLTPINNYLYWFGIGVFHSGIEAHGLEYGYGAHDYPTSGVFEVQPKRCPGFIYRHSIWLGTTDMSKSEFRSFIEHLSGEYHGNTYHLIVKNCNHFTNDVCMHLTGKPIPNWVNRLARLGSLCNCLLPEGIQITTVSHLPENQEYPEGETVSVSSSVSAESDEEEPDHRLLTAPSVDMTFVRDEPIRLVKEIV